MQVTEQQPDAAIIDRAAAVLRAGGLVAFPTETVYGLGAHALQAEAVQSIFVAKGRPANNPLIVHVAEQAAAQKLTTAWPLEAEALARRFWPGPLSLVLPKADCVPSVVTAGAGTVAVRVPAHPVARALLETAQFPIAAPSANRSNYISPTCAAHVLKGLQGRIDLLLDGGPTAGGLESTVLDLSVQPPRLLRPGLVTQAEIEAEIGPIERHAVMLSHDQPLASPGLLARHYSPRAILERVAGNGRVRIDELQEQGLSVGWLAFSDEGKHQAADAPRAPGHPELIVMPRDSQAYCAQLYAALHLLDERGVDCIIVELPPDTDEWQAVQDRLRRAERK